MSSNVFTWPTQDEPNVSHCALAPSSAPQEHIRCIQQAVLEYADDATTQVHVITQQSLLAWPQASRPVNRQGDAACAQSFNSLPCGRPP